MGCGWLYVFWQNVLVSLAIRGKKWGTNLMQLQCDIIWYHRPNYINLDITYNSRDPMYPHVPTSMTHTRSRAHLTSCTLRLYTARNSPIQLLNKYFISTWRWPLSSAETCSCNLCSKYYIYLYHQIKLC